MEMSAWDYYHHALGLSDAGEMAASLKVCSEGIERFPDNEELIVELLSQRARVYDALRQYDNAIADVTEVINRQPSVRKYWYRGHLHFKNEAYAEAIADFTEVLRHEPQNGNAFYSRGRARHALGDEVGAAEDFQQVIVLRPPNHPEVKMARQFLQEISSDSTDRAD